MMTILPAALLCTVIMAPQEGPKRAARQFHEANRSEILTEFAEFLSIPNLARDLPNIERNVDWLLRALDRRGVKAEVLRVPYAPPVVYGEIITPGAEHTLMFYAHYDGQPVQAAQWDSGDPYAATLYSNALHAGGVEMAIPKKGEALPKEARIYARSSGDDKAAIIAMLQALDALRLADIALQANIKFFFEGEEEQGSAHLGPILERNRELLAADLWIFCDGPVHQSRQQQVVFGVRGITSLELTVYGPQRALHSGHYGNWAPNPALMLSQLLASMKDVDGRVLVENFYEQVEALSDSDRQALAAAPKFDAELRREFGLGRSEGGGERLEVLLTQPSLNIRGLRSAGVGRLARNVVPATASASLDMRLVKGMDPAATLDCVIAHIERQGYHVTESDPTLALRLAHQRIVKVGRGRGYRALRTPMDLPVVQRVVAAVEAARGPVIRLPTLGGSLPLSVLASVLAVPVVIVPIANHDDNQHSANENLRLQNLWDGIETMAELLAMR